MFGMFKRVKTIVGSELNALLDKAEDPVKLLDQYMRDMKADIRDAETAVAKQIANEKKMKKSLDEAREIVNKRQTLAEKAIEQGNDDLARRALEDKNVEQKNVNSLEESYNRAKADADSLRGKLQEMQREYREMESKKDSLKARAESAKTRKKMNDAMSNIGGDSSTEGFSRMEDKVMELEAQAETSEELTSSNKSLDDELEALDRSSSVDDELAALKAKMNKDNKE